jgi:hypothetical protein
MAPTPAPVRLDIRQISTPGGKIAISNRSSCAFATAIENDKNRYPIDDLEESKECSLVTPVLGIPRTVAYGLARPLVEGTFFNSHPIQKRNAIVLGDRAKPGCNTLFFKKNRIL